MYILYLQIVSFCFFHTIKILWAKLYIYIYIYIYMEYRSVVVNVVHYDILVCEFESQSRYDIQIRTNILRKDMNSLIHPPAMV